MNVLVINGEVDLHLGMDLLNARMLVALEKGLEDGNSLRRNPKIQLAEFGNDVVQPGNDRRPVRKNLSELVLTAFPMRIVFKNNLRKQEDGV